MSSPPSSSGLEAAFLAHRDQLLRFLRARGAGDGAEDILQEVWLRIEARDAGPVSAPLAYLHATANSLMIDRYRSRQTAERREREWSELRTGEGESASQPSAERQVAAAHEAARVLAMLGRLGERVETIFRLHRVDGMAQKAVAARLGISLSTVESDLRTAYAALEEWKTRREEDLP